MANNTKNLANAIVATDVGTSATTLVLEAGYGASMPAVPFFLTCTPPGQLSTMGNSEIILVTGRSTDTLTIQRAKKQSTARDIKAGWVVSNSVYVETSVQVGDIMTTLNATPRAGRLFMNGGTYNKEDWPLMWQYIVDNPAYGTTTSTQFTLKDMSGRTQAGKASSGTFATLGQNIGAEGVTMTQDMLVGHWHSIWLNTTHSDGSATGNESLNTNLVGGGRARYRGSTGQAVNGNSWGNGAQNEVSGSIRSTPPTQIPVIQPTTVVNYEVIAE